MLLCLCMVGALLSTAVFAAGKSQFTDVKPGDYFAESVGWAVDLGLVNGTSATTFSPHQICTRAQIVTILHRYFVKPLDNSELIATHGDADPLRDYFG